MSLQEVGGWKPLRTGPWAEWTQSLSGSPEEPKDSLPLPTLVQGRLPTLSLPLPAPPYPSISSSAPSVPRGLADVAPQLPGLCNTETT